LCIYGNIEEIYNEVYSSLVTADLTVKHGDPVWRNKADEVIESEQDAFGCKSAFILIRPE
jgi:hypothetical protein